LDVSNEMLCYYLEMDGLGKYGMYVS
jgi:hypothetical protein